VRDLRHADRDTVVRRLDDCDRGPVHPGSGWNLRVGRGWQPPRPNPSTAVENGTLFRTPTEASVRPVAITDKIYLKNHRQIVSQLDTSIPKGAFKGATIELLYSGEGLSKVDNATRDRLLDFAGDFLDCDSEDQLYTGYPERQFIRYLLELRAQGLGPDAIVDVMGDDYMLYAYAGDVLSFLDQAVRTLEAAEALADVDGAQATADEVSEAKRSLAGRR
jgi:superfamily II helicase